MTIVGERCFTRMAAVAHMRLGLCYPNLEGELSKWVSPGGFGKKSIRELTVRQCIRTAVCCKHQWGLTVDAYIPAVVVAY
jgi:hypothetical protein